MVLQCPRAEGLNSTGFQTFVGAPRELRSLPFCDVPVGRSLEFERAIPGQVPPCINLLRCQPSVVSSSTRECAARYRATAMRICRALSVSPRTASCRTPAPSRAWRRYRSAQACGSRYQPSDWPSSPGAALPRATDLSVSTAPGRIVLKQRMANSPQSTSNMANRPQFLSFIVFGNFLANFASKGSSVCEDRNGPTL